jgi:hypothetical protein
MEAVARVHRRYVSPSEECPPKQRPLRGFGSLKRPKRYTPQPSATESLTKSTPYRTIFSGQTIESMVGGPIAASTRASSTPTTQTQPSPRPPPQSHNKENRYSRPTAFALLPDLHIAPEDAKLTSGDYAASTTRDSCGFHVSSHMLSASQGEREGVLFIMASLRQTLGISK